MAATLHMADEKAFGPNGENVMKLIHRLSAIDWFSAVGKQTGQVEVEKAIHEFTHRLGIDGYQICWMTKKQLPPFLQGMRLDKSPLWSRLEAIPEKIKNKAEEGGRVEIISRMTDTVPAILFHSCFGSAFREFEECGASVVKTAVGAVMYIFGLACAWEAVGDLAGQETNPFTPLMDAFTHGHWPLGLFDNQFFVI